MFFIYHMQPFKTFSHFLPFSGFRFIFHLARVQIALFLLLYPVSIRFPAQIGYRSHFSFSCTRFSSDFPFRPGTDRHFSSPVPGFRPISRSDRVQITLFLLLYPVSVRFPAQIGYRSHFSFSCTRFPSDFPLRSGTDRHFPSPVPGAMLFPCATILNRKGRMHGTLPAYSPEWIPTA